MLFLTKSDELYLFSGSKQNFYNCKGSRITVDNQSHYNFAPKAIFGILQSIYSLKHNLQKFRTISFCIKYLGHQKQKQTNLQISVINIYKIKLPL